MVQDHEGIYQRREILKRPTSQPARRQEVRRGESNEGPQAHQNNRRNPRQSEKAAGARKDRRHHRPSGRHFAAESPKVKQSLGLVKKRK